MHLDLTHNKRLRAATADHKHDIRFKIANQRKEIYAIYQRKRLSTRQAAA